MSTIALVTLAMALAGHEASAALQIYKVKGDVTVTKGKQNVKAARRAEVAASDRLTIPAGASVDILDTDSHRIFSSVTSGKMTVKDLMKEAEAHAADITRNINRKVIAAVADNAGQKRSGYDALGMAIHETDAIAYPPVTLPEGVSYLSYLMSSAQESDSPHQSFISLKTVALGSGSDATDSPFNFVLKNSMSRPLYFNIIGKDGNDKDGIRLFLPQNPVAAPNSETVATEYAFLPDGEASAYVAIASDIDFSIDDVRKLLKVGYDPDENYYLTILTVK